MAANAGPPPDLVDAAPLSGDLPDVSDFDLSGSIDVQDLNVPGVDLSGIDSSGVQLPDSNLSGIDLPDSDFSDGDLSDTNQFGVDASGIDPGIEVPGVEDSLVEIPGVGMNGIGLNEDEPFPDPPTASGPDSWTNQDPPILLQPGNATYDPGWRNDDAPRGGGGRHSGPVGPSSAFGVGAGGGASGGRGGTSAGDSSGGPSSSGGPTGQDPPTFGDPSGRGNASPASTGGSPGGGPPCSSGTSGGSASSMPAGSSGAGGTPTDGSPSTEPAGSAPGADADRGSAAGVGIPPSTADTPDAADGSPEQIDLPDGPDDVPEFASGPERDADGPDTDTEQSTDAEDGLAGQASDGADDGMQDYLDAEGSLIGSDAYPVDEDAQKGGPTAGTGTIFAFGIPENVTSHTSGPAPESQPSVIDSALVPGEVHWITERGERADAWGEWGRPFEGFNGPDLPEVRLAPDPTAPGTWLVQVKDPNPPDREIHDPRLGTIRDGLGTVDAQMITIARIETPDGGAPAVGLLREGDRLAW
jgi:hypothetical protein